MRSYTILSYPKPFLNHSFSMWILQPRPCGTQRLAPECLLQIPHDQIWTRPVQLLLGVACIPLEETRVFSASLEA